MANTEFTHTINYNAVERVYENMNCYNQQYAGMVGCNMQNHQQMPTWQNQPQPADTQMFGWQEQMMPGMDCGMPPATILPAGSTAQPATFASNMECGMFPLAMAYVPFQKWSQPSPLCEGLKRGTMFRELDLPFLMGRCQ